MDSVAENLFRQLAEIESRMAAGVSRRPVPRLRGRPRQS
jgi:hypothetical protein